MKHTHHYRPPILPTVHRLVCAAASIVALITGGGCAAFRPIEAVPARYLPDELRAHTRENLRMIDLALLRQRPPAEHLIDADDVLAVYIEGVLGQREQPPINQPFDSSRPPTLGYPLTVRSDGTLSLPLVAPIPVRGRTIPQVEQAVRYAYTVERRLLQPGRDRILVTLHQPRMHRVLVVREEHQSDRSSGNNGGNWRGGGGNGRGDLSGGTGNSRNVALPAYRNDVLNALVESGGLPGLDAQNVVYVIRSSQQHQNQPQAQATYAPQPAHVPYGMPSGPTSVPWQPPPTWNDVGLIARGGLCSSGNTIRIPLRLADCNAITFTERDIILEDGDIVFIASRDEEVFYTGGLLGGGQFVLPRDHDLDILEAIAIAQQNTSSSNQDRSALNQDVTISASEAIVLRKLPNGTQLPIRVDLYKARQYPSERILIQPSDYIILQYTKTEAVAAFVEKHIFETALFGLAAAQFQRNP